MEKYNIDVVNEMLTDRGYNSIRYFESNIIATNDNDESIIVFLVNFKINIEYLKEYIEILKLQNINKGIIVSTNDITSKGKYLVDMINSSGEMLIEIFNASDFRYNKTKHCLVPKHIKLNKIEADMIIQKYSKLSEMLISDPISRYYGFIKGDIIKIIRNNGEIFYRIVV